MSLLIVAGLNNVALSQERPRLIVLTDYFKDPDDKQSLIRLFTYANEFEIEGLIATSLAYGDGSVRPELIHEQINEYAQVFPKLQQHDRPNARYPSPDSLRQVVKAGAPVIRSLAGRKGGFDVPYPPGAIDQRRCEPAENWIGEGKDTEASNHIIRVVDRDDSRPVWVAVWGGAMDLAQAIWRIRRERSPVAAARFISRLRVNQSNWQDTGSVWLWNNVPDLYLIQSAGLVSGGMYTEGPAEMRDEAWLEANVTRGHGALGAAYPPANATGKKALTVKEGDSLTFLHLLASGLSDPEHPEWGGWGGRYRRLDPAGSFYVADEDIHPDSDDPRRRMKWTLGRWNVEIANDFAARMDRCVKSESEMNHPPTVVIDGDSTLKSLHRSVLSGQMLTLDADGTHDQDGHPLRFEWWPYEEVGTCREPVRLTSDKSSRTTLVAPKVSSTQTIHVILTVRDQGTPNLTSYRRVVITVRPQ